MRLIVTLYIPGKIANKADESADNSRSALRKIQHAALLYELQLKAVKIQRLSPDEVVQIYSYLLNLDRSLMTRRQPRQVRG